MGRRKHRPVQFVSSGTLVGDNGGHFIARSAAQQRQLQQQQQEEQLVLQALQQQDDSDLDENLQDYLQNLRQHGIASSSSDADEDSENAERQGLGRAAAAAAAAAQQHAGWDHSWDPALDARPGLGFHGAAATDFAASSLDNALEGQLAQDMLAAAGQGSSDTDGSSSSRSTALDDDDSDTDGSSSSSETGTSSSSQSEGKAAAAAALLLSGLCPGAALLVDGEGRPMAAWDQLSLQQKYPVQTRQQLKPQKQQKQQGGRHNHSRKQQQQERHGQGSSGAPALPPEDVPRFASQATTAAVAAAHAAASAAADMQSAERERQRRQQRSLAKGARGGQLLPGEKKRLRKEKIAAKRATRATVRGLSALQLLAELEEFVAGGGDVKVLPPCGKHKQSFVRALAGLFGVKAAAQGGSSSGRTCLVLHATAAAASPLAQQPGIDDSEGYASSSSKRGQVMALLTRELTSEMTAAATAAGMAVAASGRAAAPPAAAAQASPAAAGGRPGRRRSHQEQLSRSSGAELGSVFQQPVAFVPGGVLDPNTSIIAAQGNSSRAGPPQQSATTFTSTQFAAQGDRDSPDAADAAAVAGEQLPGGAAACGEAAAGAMRRQPFTDVCMFLDSLLLDGASEGDAAAAPPATAEGQPAAASPTATAGGWMLDRAPWSPQQAELGLAQSAAADVQSGAAGVTSSSLLAAHAAGDVASTAPAYDRVAVGLGFSSGGLGFAGLGFSGSSRGPEMQQQQQQSGPDVAASEEAAGPRPPSSGGRKGPCNQQVLLELEVKFTALQAAGNPAAARRQQRRQQQEQQPNSAAGPALPRSLVVAAAAAMSPSTAGGAAAVAGEDSSVVPLGLTAQQVKKAMKQQQRNQRREARAAAEAAGIAPAAEVNSGMGAVSSTFAGFEVHTTGIGSRLMAGWGWVEGQGLGRARQGRPESLRAERRPKQLGLGAE